MGVFDRFRRRKKAPYEALSDEERMSRYLYLLNTLPPSVIERAHESAFRDVPLARRQEMFEQLRPFMSEEEQKQAAEPELLARLVRRAEERRAQSAESASGTEQEREPARTTTQLAAPEFLTQNGLMALVAYNFLLSSAVTSYFTVGAGSLGLAGEPDWVGDMAGGGVDGGGGVGGGFDGGGGGIDGGGGMDSGGLGGGGFDFGGGFGGGFDGGGGFG
ncbi:hypothetical protein ACPW96_04245 [Micromonospora sp. DT81.3]|uniref:hypothetical protein n=1 Tax=Micromonospora sp. DT81.3 TaxID=3416523 RepID=UPI003CFB6306